MRNRDYKKFGTIKEFTQGHGWAVAKQDYCPFCSVWSHLYPLKDETGKMWWACKTITNAEMPNLTCYSLWRRQIVDPLKFTIKDF